MVWCLLAQSAADMTNAWLQVSIQASAGRQNHAVHSTGKDGPLVEDVERAECHIDAVHAIEWLFRLLSIGARTCIHCGVIGCTLDRP